MKRYRRITQLWNWLPAFRGVAEHRSLQKAAVALGVSPSALSRMVKLLEADLGEDLFARHPAGLRLTAFGTTLLTITRDAMRMVDDGIESRVERREHQAVFIGVTSDVAAAIVARTLPQAIARGRVTHVIRIAESSVGDELRQGNLDAVVGAAANTSSDLVSERLGSAGASICAAATHPLATARRPISIAQLSEAEYVVSAAEPNAVESVHGTIATWCNSSEVARLVCEESALLCIVPDASLRAGASSRLVKLADASPTPLFLVRRRPLGGAPEGMAPALLAELRRALA
jgi:DNA-binding transcriptional LysR family regulator